jgi:sugar (pentulose or hexulose) kinase
MYKQKVVAIFDIGKTNKKLLLFDNNLNVIFQLEEEFQTTIDEDRVECDDIGLIENWILTSLKNLIIEDKYLIKAVNFSTYGASLAFLDNDGNRLTPIYNYLKEIPGSIQKDLFEMYGGVIKFCRKTASPALGMLLNSGIQILWMKKKHPELFSRVSSILHFPQYLSYLLTKKTVSELTSIGCHTFLWDFDQMQYHKWIQEEQINLPDPLSNELVYQVEMAESKISVGIGIHDSSASLAPYLLGSEKKFILLSTGTWCINMNPFNHEPLTEKQLKADCLSYLSIDQHPVKSSRLFLGHIHDVNSERLALYFNVPKESYKSVKINKNLLLVYLKDGQNKLVFFEKGIPSDYIDKEIDLSQFSDYSEAYHRLMYDLTILNARSVNLVQSQKDGVENIYISGGFARNEIFVRLMKNLYPDKGVFTSEIDNSSALGAALVVWDAMNPGEKPKINLGLKEWTAF